MDRYLIEDTRLFMKKDFIKNTLIIASLSQASKVLGIIRELLMIKIMGVGFLSDAFFTAYKVPTTLRKIMAEGALSNTVIPYFSEQSKTTQQSAISGLVTLTFILLQIVCFIITFCGIFSAKEIISLIAPGFDENQIFYATKYLRIFMPFTFFITGTSLIASVLQSSRHFIIPASIPLTLNICVITSLCLTYFFQGPTTWICWGLLAGGILQAFIHIIAYYRYGFRFCWWEQKDIATIKHMLKSFLIYLPTVSFSELNLFIDTSFASTLCQGTVSLLYYANRFMGIPLGVVIGSFTTVLLPALSAFSSRKNRRRLSFYLHHAIIFVLWITIPLTLLMMTNSTHLFTTLFLSKDFSATHANQAGHLLQLFSCGLIFLSINRVLLNVFYSLKNTLIPTIIALASLLFNTIGNFILIGKFGASGLVIATTLSGLLQMILSYFFLYREYHVGIHKGQLLFFLRNYISQLIVIGIPFSIVYCIISFILKEYFPLQLSLFFLEKIGYWFWMGPLCIFFCIIVWWWRTLFNVRIFFIE
jgi:putative peptidoglycan lipid II flippase